MKRKKPFAEILKKLNTEMQHLDYADRTIRSYDWQAKRFLENLSVPPEQATEQEILKYFDRIQRDQMSKPYFLQASTTAQLIFDHVVKRKVPLPSNFFNKVRQKYLKKMSKSVEKESNQKSI